MYKRILLLFAIILFTSPLLAQSAKTDTISTYFLIRHAEKDRSDATNKNPNLTEQGTLRAKRWNELLSQFHIDKVYSTNYNRTLQTAMPTAKNNNLTITTYHPFKIDMQQFLKDTKGKSVLIVGHSNTIPSFVNKLIGKETYQDIDDANNANLYIVTIKGDKKSHVLLVLK